MSSCNFIPNLPGFKPHEVHKSGQKKHFLSITGGHRFVEDSKYEAFSNYDLTASASIASLGSVSPTKISGSSTSLQPILKFAAEFDGGRKCTILFYVEDNSIKIVESTEANSGRGSGVFLKRGLAPKADGSYIQLDDLQIDSEVVIFNRLFYIVGCNDFTRNYLVNEGRSIDDSKDAYFTKKAEMKSHDIQSHRVRKNSLKGFIEAKLGNTSNTLGREGFMEYGNQVLKFLCYWDDSESLYGDKWDFVLIYHLADDSIEIVTSSNAAAKQFPRLLKRTQLPRDFGSTTENLGSTYSEPKYQNYYHWTDFYIGGEVNVYGRKLLIVDADSTTRKFYAENDYPLGDALKIDKGGQDFTYTREIPPHNGFGSEEDSLKSCIGTLMPKAGLSRTNFTESRVLCFLASLLSSNDDPSRKFVITYYFQDGTLKVQEPPCRNSGYVGGLFLSRRKVKRLGSSEYLNENDFHLGEEVCILTHRFLLTGANEFTTKWLDSQQSQSKEEK